MHKVHCAQEIRVHNCVHSRRGGLEILSYVERRRILNAELIALIRKLAQKRRPVRSARRLAVLAMKSLIQYKRANFQLRKTLRSP
eukprot:scaffold256172_cov39-Tisochrysis_lutea.AAC.1